MPDSPDQNPDVGPRPFEANATDRARFFGRERETNEIVSLIRAIQSSSPTPSRARAKLRSSMCASRPRYRGTGSMSSPWPECSAPLRREWIRPA